MFSARTAFKKLFLKLYRYFVAKNDIALQNVLACSFESNKIGKEGIKLYISGVSNIFL